MIEQRIVEALFPVYRNRWLVIVVSASVFAISVAFAVFYGTYEAETILTITAFKGTSETQALLPDTLNVESYRLLALSGTVLSDTIDLLVQGGFFGQNEPPRLRDFRKRMYAETEVVDQTTRPVNYAPFLVLRVVRESPDAARAVCDSWAKAITAVASRDVALHIVTPIESLREEREKVGKRLASLWEQLAEEEAKYNIEDLQRQFSLLTESISGFEKELVSLESNRASAQSRLTSIRERCAEEPPTLRLFRSPSDDAYWLSSGDTGPGPSAVPSQGMVTEEINPTYAQLQIDETSALQSLAGTTAEIESVTRQLEDLSAKRDQVRQDLATHRYAQQRLETDAEIARGIYVDIDGLVGLGEALGSLAGPRTGASDAEDHPIGLNRLSVRTAVDRGGRMMKVLLSTLVASALAVAYVTLLPQLRALGGDLYAKRQAVGDDREETQPGD